MANLVDMRDVSFTRGNRCIFDNISLTVPPRLCYRNLFYTGVTRARRLCVVAGRSDVVNSMMSNIRQNLRYSGLCSLLQAGQSPEQLSTEGESP